MLKSFVRPRPADSPAVSEAAGPPSPAPRRFRQPNWLDLRLVLGVLLVLGSVAIGVRVVAASDDRVGVWQATRDLAPGTVLAPEDVRIAQVRLPTTQQYVSAAEPVVGQALRRAVGADELVPRSGLGAPSEAMAVTIPVLAADAPAVERGGRIRVWVSTATCRGAVVLSDVVVQDIVAPRSGGLSTSSRLSITVRVEPQLAARVVEALDLPSAVIRIGVLSSSTGPAQSTAGLPDLATCEGGR